MAQFCKTCIFYEKEIFTRIGDKFGICKNVEASSKIVQDSETKINEDNTVYTSEYFGCIYWRNTGNIIIDTSKIIKNEC